MVVAFILADETAAEVQTAGAVVDDHSSFLVVDSFLEEDSYQVVELSFLAEEVEVVTGLVMVQGQSVMVKVVALVTV